VRQLRSILVLPFLVTVIVPGLFVWWRGEPYLGSRPTALAAGGPLIAVGLVFVVWTIALFGLRGRGTLAPWDPPEKLVITGPYRFVRNPMIAGVALILVGEALLFAAPEIGIWWMLFVFANALYIPLKEEPALLERFGDEYARYVRNVPAFAPRSSAWRGTDDGTPRRNADEMPLVNVPADQVRAVLTIYALAIGALLLFVGLLVWTAIGGGPSALWLLVAGVVTWALLDLRDARLDALRAPPPMLLFGRLHADAKTFEVRESPDGKPVGGWRFVRRDKGAFVLMRPRIASRALVRRHRPSALPFRMATLYEPRGKPDDEGWIRYPAAATFEDPPGSWTPVKKKK
jgi:protein-S-isoprenylcysteine O-methyltransferase Ste14